MPQSRFGNGARNKIISQPTRIGICAPSTAFTREDADRVIELAAESHDNCELIFAGQCFVEDGHFAGNDQLRRETFISLANDPGIDAVWFVRGGYGAARMAVDISSELTDAAHAKLYMGYSDAGNLLGSLYKANVGTQAHGPMPTDIRRHDGDRAVRRALDWIVHRDPAALDPGLEPSHKYAAFNLMTLAMMTGTPLMPDLSGHVLMIEEVSEHLYAFDRAMFHITSNLQNQGLTGLRLGQVTDIPENDRPFGENAEEITRRWCREYGIAFLGAANIGHSSGNMVVPFGNSSGWFANG